MDPLLIEENAAAVLSCAREIAPGVDSFREAISLLQSPEIQLDGLAKSPKTIWFGPQDDGTKVAAILSELMGGIEIAPDFVYDGHERSNHEALMAAGTAHLRAAFPRTFAALESILVSIIYAKRSGFDGGSVSSRIGFIWLSPDAGWTSYRFGENLLHEFVHNALFLDDMVNKIFTAPPGRLSRDDALTMSAMRRTRRGYDKTFHSAFVAYVTITYDLAMGLREKAHSLIAPLLICLEALTNNQAFISPHGARLLRELALATLRLHETLQQPTRGL